MLNILLIMTAREVGGAEHYVERLVENLRDACRFTVAVSNHPNLTGLRERLGEMAELRPYAFDQPIRLLAIMRELRGLAPGFDIVHINSNHPGSRLGILLGLALPGAGTPVVCVEQRATPMEDVITPRSIAWALPTLFRWSRRRVARTVAVSHDNRRTLEGYYHLPPDRIQVIYNGADLSRFSAPPAAGPSLRDELGLAAGQPILLVAARLAANKGQRYLVSAAPAILQQFPDAHFVFAGSPDDPSLERQIADSGLADHFSLLGFRQDAPRLLHECDVLVSPSLAEGFALTILEALAAGAIVVATRVGGADEIIVPGQNGFLVPPADPAALAGGAIQALSLDRTRRAALSRAAQATAGQFSLHAMSQQMLALYRRLAATKEG